jgi:tetratricopeptide (TPR) repeat protein
MEKRGWLEILNWQAGEIEDLRYMGYSYIKQGHYDIALKFFEALTILSNEDVYDLQTLGALYLQTGNNLMALNYLEKAIKCDPSHGPTLLNRSKALLALGYKKQGLMQAKSLEVHPESAISSQAAALSLAYS